MTPNFDEIVGSELSYAEREKLRQVHELLVVAGPPPELPPPLEQAPEVDGNVHVLRRKNVGRRAFILLAAALTIAIVFIGGFSAGHTGGGKAALSLSMQGTALAPRARAQLAVFRPTAGNWPMKLTVSNLPKLPQRAYYEVYLVRNGKPYGSCGTFTVKTTSHPITVSLTAPYALRSNDTWIVTRERAGESGPGQTVLRTAGRV